MHPARSFFSVLMMTALGAGLLGCQNMPLTTAGAKKLPSASNIYLVHLPGMAGWVITDQNWVIGLGEGGVADHLEIYDWTRPNWLIGAVQSYDHNRASAREVAAGITATVRRDPNAKIVLTGWSAGAAVAIWALEDLPDDVQVQSVLFIQSAVDPNHDLSRALRHVRGHMFSTIGFNDWLILGIGTVIFGTADGGVHTASAGNVGFAKPPGRDAIQYQKLVEIPYQFEWMKYANFGEHTGPTSQDFAREVLAPMVVKDIASPTGGALQPQGR
jgi:pimeloyl-ACP methyl ester carboxylesterase